MEPFYLLAPASVVTTVFCCGTWPPGGDRWNTFFVFAVIGTSRQDRSPLVYFYVRADRGNKTAAKVRGTADLFLSPMLSRPGYGTTPRGRSQRCCLEDDQRPRRVGPGTEPGGLGDPARGCGFVAA